MEREAVIILAQGSIAYEIVTAAEVLGRRLPVFVATPRGEDHSDENGLRYRADGAISAVDAEAVACLVIAGGDMESALEDDALHALVRAVHARRVPIGAICAAPIVLARAGVLIDREFTHTCIYPPSMQGVFDGTRFVERPLVVSDHIVTATPEAHIDFAVELAFQLGHLDADAAARKRDYLKGNYARDWTRSGPIGDED